MQETTTEFDTLHIKDRILIDSKILSLVLEKAQKKPKKGDTSNWLQDFADDQRASFAEKTKRRRKLWTTTAEEKICAIEEKENSYTALSRAERIIADAAVLGILLDIDLTAHSSGATLDNKDISDLIVKERELYAKSALVRRQSTR